MSHNGEDLSNCGNRTIPCRTVRYAVNISEEGDEIYIDYAHGKPYLECEGVKKEKKNIDLTKSISFLGLNGKSEIKCTKSYDLFHITSPSFKIARVKFHNLVISKTKIVARLATGARFELVFQNVVLKDHALVAYSKQSFHCSLIVTNTSFEKCFPGGIRLQCLNVSAIIRYSSFRLTPVFFANIGNKSPHLQSMRVWIENIDVDGENTPMCEVDMFGFQPYAAVSNVTITNSHYKNHLANCEFGKKISTLHIRGKSAKVGNYSYIFISKLIMENTLTNWGTLSLAIGYQRLTKGKTMIRDCIFRNNSGALRLASYRTVRKPPVIHLENNTFLDNTNRVLQPYAAAAIYLSDGRFKMASCRFIDNKTGKNPYQSVVTISERASSSFFNSYFENRQTQSAANQVFVIGSRATNFRGNATFNLLALKEKQSVLIRIPTAINTGVILRKNFKISCPQGYKINPTRECKNIKNAIICFYMNIACEQCPPKTYTIERGELIYNTSNNIKCQECPRGGDCDDGLVKAKPNFWGYSKNREVIFLQCPPGYCCESTNANCASYNSCDGDRFGTLCGRCPQGMSESLFSTKCISNAKCSSNYFFILGIIAYFPLFH